jgi:excisionase family DNA binding protein
MGSTLTRTPTKPALGVGVSHDLAPRLLNVHEAGKYLGVSSWTIRSLVSDGHLHPVRLPSVRHRGELGRRLLLDRADLDAAIGGWKEATR